MGRKQETERGARSRTWWDWVRYAALSLAAMGFLAAGLLLYDRGDRFLASARQFQLAPPGADGESPSFQIRGDHYTSRSRILSVFAQDFRQSVYLVPLEERRRALLEIDWVKDATVCRLWPNRLEISIRERTPAAFVQLAPLRGQGPAEVALVDEEGVILELPPKANFKLPVLAGIRRDQSLASRRTRVSAALSLLSEAGPVAGQISEIDVSEPENLKVLQEVGGRVVLLYLGDRNFQTRLRNFLNHFDQIHQRMPEIITFDLRLDDRITAVKEGSRRG